jgi:hypothetical protein
LWPFNSTTRSKPDASGLKEVLADHSGLILSLESRVERLELQHGERHVTVLNTLEKLNRQFKARERMRDKADGEAFEDPPTPIQAHPEIVRPGRPQRDVVRTDHLAQRFRR